MIIIVIWLNEINRLTELNLIKEPRRGGRIISSVFVIRFHILNQEPEASFVDFFPLSAVHLTILEWFSSQNILIIS